MCIDYDIPRFLFCILQQHPYSRYFNKMGHFPKIRNTWFWKCKEKFLWFWKFWGCHIRDTTNCWRIWVIIVSERSGSLLLLDHPLLFKCENGAHLEEGRKGGFMTAYGGNDIVLWGKAIECIIHKIFSPRPKNKYWKVDSRCFWDEYNIP